MGEWSYVEVSLAEAREDEVAWLDVDVRLATTERNAIGGGRSTEQTSKLRVQP